jgi:hypothetical protein
MSALTICSKSQWLPTIRREHAFTGAALRRGLEVTFVEPPTDVRGVDATHPWRFVEALSGVEQPGSRPGLHVIARTAPVPGHRGTVAETIETVLLRRVLCERTDPEAPAVVQLPWQWPATAGRRRRVFDCADDWIQLFPHARRSRFTELFRRISDEADDVIVASDEVAHLFAGRDVIAVPNGADPASVAASPPARPDRCRLAYVGTLSERFDVALITAVLRALPHWSLALYGPCAYAGRGSQPSPELASFLTTFGPRARWHGTIPRTGVPAAIDDADVFVIPNRRHLSEGQSSMKLYDSAARGRPAVVTSGVTCTGSELPPATWVADTVDQWVEGIIAGAAEPDGVAATRLTWARANTWEQRWPAWIAGVTGGDSARG